MTAEERKDLLEHLKRHRGKKRKLLAELGIPESTYYAWKRAYEKGGMPALEKNGSAPSRIWNRLTQTEIQTVLRVARAHPELSSRLLAVKITDEEAFSVSEPTVYRILKKNHLIAPRPLPELPAAKSFHTKTTRINEMWQMDATTFFVVNWGYYKHIPVLDDYSRKVLAWELQPDESAGSISTVIEKAVEATGIKHLPDEQKPTLLSDNGPGFAATLLAAYLENHNIRHIFGHPYHPQTQGKVERLHKRIKKNVCLLVYLNPQQLWEALAQEIERYNETPHEALKNVSPNDMYAGRQEEILKRRAEKKKLTLERRKRINLGLEPEVLTCVH